MIITFDSPGKKYIRENWNSPLLQEYSTQKGIKYLYLGLPGPKISDIKLWKDFIEYVIAFETKGRGLDPRENIIVLNRNLTVLGLKYDVYYGFLENVIIVGKDSDGKIYKQEGLVTLYNLDFCNSITGKIDTEEGRRCLRFETLRKLMTIQRDIYLKNGMDKFILLLTIRDEFRTSVLKEFIERSNYSEKVRNYINCSLKETPMDGNLDLQNNTPILKAFIFTILRDYFKGHNIASFFFPIIKYIGRTSRSKMLHFTILCRMESECLPQPNEFQTAEEFLMQKSLFAKGDSIYEYPLCSMECDSKYDISSVSIFKTIEKEF